MRILVATDQWFPDTVGGVARVATDTSRGWAGSGHEVVVVAPQRNGRPSVEHDGKLSLYRALPRGWRPQTLTDPPATRRAASDIGADGFDVHVAHTSTTARGLLATHSGVPLVYVFHADPVQESRHLRTTNPPRRERLSALALEPALELFGRSSLHQASSIIVLSEYSRSLLADIDSDAARHAVLVAGAVDTDAFTPEGREEARLRLGVPSSATLVLTVRRLVPRMGIPQLLDAASLLSDVDGLHVAVAGSGPLASELSDRRNRLGLSDRVTFLGRVSDEELPLWYKAADLFVLPTIAHEGFGLVTAEALASGTPVVGTPVGATPELIRPLEPRLLARGIEPAELADAIRTGLVLATPELRARARAYAVEHLSWNSSLPAWEAVIASAASSEGPRQSVA